MDRAIARYIEKYAIGTEKSLMIVLQTKKISVAKSDASIFVYDFQNNNMAVIDRDFTPERTSKEIFESLSSFSLK